MKEDAYLSEREVIVKVPVAEENIREEFNFFEDLRKIFRLYEKDTDQIDFIIKNLEDKIEVYDEGRPILPNREEIVDALEKHPYFKTPGDYPIRLLTIMKYLKKKGFDLNYADMDLYIENILQEMDGVKKVGRGLFKKIVSQ